MFFDDIDDFLRPRADFVLVPAFEHHAQERLRARIADEQTALAVHARFDARDGGSNGGDRRQVDLVAAAHSPSPVKR